MAQIFIVFIFSVTTILLVLSFNFILQWSLIQILFYNGFYFFLTPLFAALGFYISKVLLTKLYFLKDSIYLNQLFKRKKDKVQFEYNTIEKLAMFGSFLSGFASFFLSFFLFILMMSYNENFHFSNFGTHGTLLIQNKDTFINHGTNHRLTGKLTSNQLQKENIFLVVDKEKYESLSIGDSIPVFFSKEDPSFIREDK